MKKLILMILLSVMIFTLGIPAAAETTGDASAASSEGSSLIPGVAYTIAQLQEMAVKNSRQALIDDVDIKKMEMATRTVYSDTTSMSDTILSVTKPMESKLNLANAKLVKQDNLNQLKADVYKNAMNILLALKEIELQEQKLVISEDRLKMAQARYDAATVTADEVDSAEYTVESSRINLTSAKENLNSLYLDLKKLLNQSLNTDPVSISTELKQAAFKESDVNTVLSDLYKTETSVTKAAIQVDIAQTAMDIAAKHYKKGDNTYDGAVLDLEEAKLDLLTAKSSLDAKVKNQYNTVLNALDNVGLAEKYTVLTEKKLATAQTKYDKGTVNKEVLMSAQEAYLDAQFSNLTSITDFNNTKIELDNMLDRL
jgi:outer membrane protein TolC